MRYFIYLALILVCYGGLFWISTKGEATRIKMIFGAATVLAFSSLLISMFLDLFYTLIFVSLVFAVASYIGSSSKYKAGKTIKNGIFGGIWLALPMYAYLVNNT
jgi:hypothetical protein